MSSQKGRNLPGFVETQLDFAAHIRNPEVNARPDGIEARRMQIYLDLFYKNIEGFLASGFPITRDLLDDDTWHALARRFVHRHCSESPYFLEITQEFLAFISEQAAELDDLELPPFLLEFCHYEWVELAIGVDDQVMPQADPGGDLINGRIVLNPVIWPLTYQWPVHVIGPDNRPDAPGETPTWLIVYRRRDDTVHFMVSSPATHRLLELLDETSTGGEALTALATENPQLAEADVVRAGRATLERLLDAQIVLGTQF